MASTLEVSVSSEGRVLAKQLYRGAALLRSCAFFLFLHGLWNLYYIFITMVFH